MPVPVPRDDEEAHNNRVADSAEKTNEIEVIEVAKTSETKMNAIENMYIEEENVV